MFFTFFPNFTFWGWGKRAKNDLKWQKIVYRIPYLSKHTSYDCVFCGSSFKWWHLQMLCSFFFSKFWGWGVKGQKMTQNDKMILTPYLWNCSSYDCGFWYTCVNWWYLQQFFIFFSFFQNYDFSGFSKFINKCQKEIASHLHFLTAIWLTYSH